MNVNLNILAASLPDETHVYCGHEYAIQNLGFALSVEPSNEVLANKYRDIQVRACVLCVCLRDFFARVCLMNSLSLSLTLSLSLSLSGEALSRTTLSTLNNRRREGLQSVYAFTLT